MKFGTKQIALVIVVLTFVGLVQACTGSSTPEVNSQTTTEGTPSAPAAFEAAELAINPAEVYPGVEVIITAQVTNTGDTEGTYTAGLRIDDDTAGTAVATLAAGESQPVSFVGSMATPGTYKITWAELVGGFLVPRLTGELVVVEDEPTQSSDS